MLPELFDHQDQNVRACSKGLTLELCRWIGKDPVKSILFEKMRDTMVCHCYMFIHGDGSSFFLSELIPFAIFPEEKRVGGRACQCNRDSQAISQNKVNKLLLL